MQRSNLFICICIYLCVSAEKDREMNDPNPKLLANFRNFEVCLNNFNIFENKIIRTEDSRAMGAKYISESEMSTREECLRLCCVTDTCDVFVFEEKKPGSCYLFNCGSAADFKCKFTKHQNYSSGVLTVEHQMNAVLEQDTASKHEQELNQLRKQDISPAMELNLTFGATAQPHPVLQRTFQKPNVTKDQSLPPKTRQCSRFQFKCRTSGECIAIYNACDGIPQCSDGSDEALELGCPTPVTSAVLPMAMNSGNKTDEEDTLQKSYANTYYTRLPKISLPQKMENINTDNHSKQAVAGEHDDSGNEQSHQAQAPLSTSNTLKQPEINHMVPLEYQSVHQQSHFKKPEEPSERNALADYSGYDKPLMPRDSKDVIFDDGGDTISQLASASKAKGPTEALDADFKWRLEHQKALHPPHSFSAAPSTGFRHYLNSHREHENIGEEHSYIEEKLMEGHNKDIENTDFIHKSQNLNLQPLIKPTFLEKEINIPAIDENREHPSLFQNADHTAKTLSPLQMQLQKQKSGLATALRHQLTNIRLSEMQSRVYQGEHAEPKETKSPLENPEHIPHIPHVGSQNTKNDNNGLHSEAHVEVDDKHQLRNNMKEQLQMPYQEPPLQDVPDRSYKYEDEDRHIFNHKGYGLIAESDSSEIPYRIAVPNGQYKLSNPQSDGFINNIPEYGNKLQRNMWTEQIRPTSHELKVLKNTPQPTDAENRYPIPSDYLYDEGQHSLLHAVSLVPHRPSSEHHLTSHTGGTLERTSTSLGTMRQQDHSDDGISKIIISNHVKPSVHEEDLSLKHGYTAYESEKQTSTDATTTSAHQIAEVPKEKTVEKSHHERYVSLQQAYISELPNDQQQDRPSGALLSMSFGLCITFVMVVLVVCRLRVVKRRLRRNGKSLYAHDADYLVNGMYL